MQVFGGAGVAGLGLGLGLGLGFCQILSGSVSIFIVASKIINGGALVGYSQLCRADYNM